MDFSCGSKASDHEANHANAQHGLAMIEPHLIIGAQPPRLAEPAKGSFDDPAFGQNLESFGSITAPHEFQMKFAGKAGYAR